MSSTKKIAVASPEMLRKIFTLPEEKNSKLTEIEEAISKNLHGFLKEKIVASKDLVTNIEDSFRNYTIPENPRFVSDHADYLLREVVSQSVHTYSPKFIGHMTSALPYFMMPLAKIMIALNQNLVKIETSKSFTPLEKQTIALLHRLVYRNEPAFYKKNIQKPDTALGLFCSGGTIANVSALWAARNQLFKSQGNFAGIQHEGLAASLKHYGYEDIAVLVSKRGHYSLAKSADILGIGKNKLIQIPVNADHKCNTQKLEETIVHLEKNKIRTFAVVGIAGTTETGHIDPLREMSIICKRHSIHFHVDAAWGGPVLFSQTHSKMLDGIDEADSVTFDAHKQLYVPIGSGVLLFKDPEMVLSIKHSANYIIRKGSKDLGKYSLEGSRPGMAMLVDSALHIIGRKGYEILVDQSIEKARDFAEKIKSTEGFELTSEPQTNILTYRYIPKNLYTQLNKALKGRDEKQAGLINLEINKIVIQMQKSQRAAGKSFVSRTKICSRKYYDQSIDVFRVVLVNPLTEENHLHEILSEQKAIYESQFTEE